MTSDPSSEALASLTTLSKYLALRQGGDRIKSVFYKANSTSNKDTLVGYCNNPKKKILELY